jgi:hypothetical protein
MFRNHTYKTRSTVSLPGNFRNRNTKQYTQSDIAYRNRTWRWWTTFNDLDQNTYFNFDRSYVACLNAMSANTHNLPTTTSSPYGALTTISGTANVLNTLFSDVFNTSGLAQSESRPSTRISTGNDEDIDESNEIVFDPLK